MIDSSVFLSHNHADKSFARRLAHDLEAAGVRVWLDEAELMIGDSLIEKICQGIDEMEYLGVILSQNSVSSEWVKREIDVAMNREIEGKRIKVLPLVIEDCELPGFLKGKLYADFRAPEQYEEELAKILRRLGKSPPVPAAKRTVAPNSIKSVLRWFVSLAAVAIVLAGIYYYIVSDDHVVEPPIQPVLLPETFHDLLIDGSKGPEMVKIPAGKFQMGSPDYEEDRHDDQRMHTVHIASFAISKYEITVEQFRAFVDTTSYRTAAEKGFGCYAWTDKQWKLDEKFSWRNVGFGQTDDHPVACVNWNDAVAYAQWLSKQTGETYRLPTEAEWEYAARASTTTPYYFGETISKDQANFNLYHGKMTVSIGQFPGNAWGMHDMHGNVGEWTCSEYDRDYSGAEQRCASPNHISVPRVFRGGGWNHGRLGVRLAKRDKAWPVGRNNTVGFRVARDLSRID